MNDKPPMPNARDVAETDALLRSTGELPLKKSAVLNAALARDAEAAAFAEFVERELPLAAKAPRDFAAAAIHAAESAPRDFAKIAIEAVLPEQRRLLVFPRVVKMLAAAAAVLVAGFLIHSQWPSSDPTPQVATVPQRTPRETEKLSTDLATLEAELAQSTARLAHSRYQRPPI